MSTQEAGSAAQTQEEAMESENLLVLEMIERGKISVCQALELIAALKNSAFGGQDLFSPDEPLTIEISLN